MGEQNRKRKRREKLPGEVKVENSRLKRFKERRGKKFQFDEAAYDDPDSGKRMHIIEGSLEDSDVTISKHIDANKVRDEVLDLIAADMQRMLELEEHHRRIGGLGRLGEVPIDEEEPES